MNLTMFWWGLGGGSLVGIAVVSAYLLENRIELRINDVYSSEVRTIYLDAEHAYLRLLAVPVSAVVLAALALLLGVGR
jgi:hypothetical protein